MNLTYNFNILLSGKNKNQKKANQLTLAKLDELAKNCEAGELANN